MLIIQESEDYNGREVKGGQVIYHIATTTKNNTNTTVATTSNDHIQIQRFDNEEIGGGLTRNNFMDSTHIDHESSDNIEEEQEGDAHNYPRVYDSTKYLVD